MKKYQMKKFQCECGFVIGLNQVKRHKQGKSHLQRMELKNKKKEEKILLEDCYTCKGCDLLMVKGTHNLNYVNDEVYCNTCIDKKIYDDDMSNFVNTNCPHSLVHIDNCYECECCEYLLCKDCNTHSYFKDYNICCYECIDKIKENDKINDKWTEIVERRSHYLKQEEQDRERDLRIIQLSNISDKYLEWLID